MFDMVDKKSPQVVKQVVKGEKWACSTLEAGKDKPVLFVAKMRDFKRFSEINKEKSGILRLPIFGLSGTLRTLGVCDRRVANTIWYAKHTPCVALPKI